MANSFGKYTGGIAPIQGLYEMGAQIGKNYAAGITAVSQNITKGIEDYNKIESESKYADEELRAEGAKYTALAQMLGSEPATAHLVEGITPILEAVATGRKSSHSKKMAALSQVKSQGKTLTETFGYLGLVQKAKEGRIFEEGLEQPPEGEETRVLSFGANAEDTKWSPNLGYRDNVERVSGNYDKWIEQNADAIRNGKVKVIPKAQFISDWLKRLPSVFDANPNMSPAQKAHAKDILFRNQTLEGIDVDNDPAWDGLRGVVEFDQKYDTINQYAGSGESAPASASRAAGAGGAMATPRVPVTRSGNHPQAEQLFLENKSLLRERDGLQSKIGTRWFGRGDDADRTRVKEINKQLVANSGIIESLGGYSPPAPAPVPVRPEAATTGLPDISLPVQRPVVVPDKVVEDSEPPAPPAVTRAVVTPRAVAPPVVVAPPRMAQPPVVVAPPKVVEKAQEPVVVPEKVAPARAMPQQVKPTPAPVSSSNKPKGAVATRPTGNEDYITQKGETLHSIAGAAGVTRRALAKANGVNLNHDFKGGEKIFIPPTAEQNRAADRPDISSERLGEPSTDNSTESMYPEKVVSDDAMDTGEQPSSYDPETGNLVINEDILAKRKQEVEDDAVGEDDIETGEFKPIKLRPLTTRKPMEAPSLPAGVREKYTPDQMDDIKIARRHIEETKSELESQNRSVLPAIDYLQRIKDNVMRGDASAVDFGTYGQWQKEHPDAATAISVGTQAAALWVGGGWSKTIKGANQIQKTNLAAKELKYARELAEAAFDSQSLKLGRPLTDAEIGTLTVNAFKKSGLATHPLDAAEKLKIGTAVAKSTGKSIFWETLALEMAGAGDDGFNVPDNANNTEIRNHLKETLKDIRQIRAGVNGGYNEWIPFGLGDEKITAREVGAIRDKIDKKITKLKEVTDDNDKQIEHLRVNSTPDNLLNLAGNLRKDSWSKLAALDMAKANGIEITEDFLEDDIGVGTQPIASKEIVIPQSNEKKKEQLKSYMKARLGHIPAGFDDAWRKNFPESTLQVKETPYGVFYTDGKGEWKQVSSKESKQLQPHEVASNKAVQFGELNQDGTYTPTEFIKGTGIKLGGIGSFGTPTDASKFRKDYAKKIRAVKIANELRKLNEVTFRSLMPSEWGRSKAMTVSLIADLRTELIGVGSVSDFEQELLRELVTNPTEFWTLQSTTRAKYETMIEHLSASLLTDPQNYGLEVQMPKDRASELKNIRGLYKAQEERYKDKMAEYGNANPRK